MKAQHAKEKGREATNEKISQRVAAKRALGFHLSACKKTANLKLVLRKKVPIESQQADEGKDRAESNGDEGGVEEKKRRSGGGNARPGGPAQTTRLGRGALDQVEGPWYLVGT